MLKRVSIFFSTQACKLYPQLRNNIEYVEIGTPVTNKHYFGNLHGELYGLDHSIERLSLSVDTKLRPKTDIPGLYLTGQDVVLGSFTGAMFSGLLCASSILGNATLLNFELWCAKVKKDIQGKNRKFNVNSNEIEKNK